MFLYNETEAPPRAQSELREEIERERERERESELVEFLARKIYFIDDNASFDSLLSF